MPSSPQDEGKRVREDFVVTQDGWVWKPSVAPYPPSVSVVLNGRQLENVTYDPELGLGNLAWPIGAADVVSIAYTPLEGRQP